MQTLTDISQKQSATFMKIQGKLTVSITYGVTTQRSRWILSFSSTDAFLREEGAVVIDSMC